MTDEEIVSLIQQTRDDDSDENEEADDHVPQISHAEAARAFELPLAYVEPVSYTHLDVYKRQPPMVDCFILKIGKGLVNIVIIHHGKV